MELGKRSIQHGTLNQNNHQTLKLKYYNIYNFTNKLTKKKNII